MKRLSPLEWTDCGSYRKRVLAPETEMGEKTLMQMVEVPPGNHIKKHYHTETVETYYILQAGGRLVIDGTEFEPKHNETILNEPGDVHEIYNDSNQVFRLLVVKTNLKSDDTVWNVDADNQE